MKILIPGVLALMMIACSAKEPTSKLEDDLVGEWRNTYLHVTMPTIGNSDSTSVTTCDSSNWEQMLHIKPIHTFFNQDGTYRSEYYTLTDSLFRKATGQWHVVGDTLVMAESGGATYNMKTTINGRVAEFESMLDFDQDGKEDDHYLGRQKKQ